MAAAWSARVYAAVRLIPRGKVATYGQVARLLGRPHGAREVGWALSGCTDGSVPCHRVVDRDGRLAARFTAQRARLRREGVPFTGARVALARAAWQPTPRVLYALDRNADAGP